MSAQSPHKNANIANVYNENYSDIWNFSGYNGTVVIDLGPTKNIKFIRITPRSSVALSDVAPFVYSFAPALNSTGTESGAYQGGSVPKHGDRAPITIPLATDINTRYLKFNGHNYGSWFALAEIEVFGL